MSHRAVPRPRRRRRPPRHVVGFLAPAVLLYGVLIVYPIVGSFRASLFTDTEPGRSEFIGLGNYRTLFTDDYWSTSLVRAVGHTVWWFVVHLSVQNLLGLGLALLLTSPRLKARSTLRAFIFSPSVISVVIVGFAWKLILSPLWGVTPSVLGKVGLEGLYQPWLGQEGSALNALALISVWQNVGLPMLLFSAALLGIPDELIEAARVDGAGAWSTFWRVQFPLILPTVGMVAILTFVGSSRAFDLVYAVQGSLAGPSFASDVMGTFFYRTLSGFFTEVPNPEMAATIATVTVATVGVVVVLYLSVVQRRLQRVSS
jgi:raffinose/stachyose/melibiose transport system permease protein